LAAITAPSAFAANTCIAGGGSIMTAGSPGQHLITVAWGVSGNTCTSSWVGNVDLRNSSGVSNMAGYPYNISGTGPVTWADNGLFCAAGKTTHTFMFVNNQGNASSFTGNPFTCP
jgi:hypothetical protein